MFRVTFRPYVKYLKLVKTLTQSNCFWKATLLMDEIQKAIKKRGRKKKKILINKNKRKKRKSTRKKSTLDLGFITREVRDKNIVKNIWRDKSINYAKILVCFIVDTIEQKRKIFCKLVDILTMILDMLYWEYLIADDDNNVEQFNDFLYSTYVDLYLNVYKKNQDFTKTIRNLKRDLKINTKIIVIKRAY